MKLAQENVVLNPFVGFKIKIQWPDNWTSANPIVQWQPLPEASPPTKGHTAVRDIVFYLVTPIDCLIDAPIDFSQIT